jgi:capsular polysaccharide biosynthesis protein
MSFIIDKLRYLKRKIKQFFLDCDRHIPANSLYIGSVKGYYAFSKEYWQLCKHNQSNNVDYIPFLSSSLTENKPPHTIYRTLHWRFNLWLCEGRYLYENPETFVMTISNGKVYGNMGTIVTHDNKLLLDVSLQFGVGRDVGKIRSHLAFNYLKVSQWQPVSETAAVLATSGAEGYYHWLTDALPRLEILRKVLPANIEITKYIVNNGIPIVSESLELLGIPRDKLIFIDRTKHFQVKNLVVPSLPGSTGTPPPWIYTFLRESFLKYKANIPPLSRLYVSRSKARYRKVTNEEDVLRCLTAVGFTPVWLEEHDFATQIALFANAEFIVAPHGAGLTNLIWCQPGSKVLEIFSPNYVNICYWAMANQIGVEYHYLIGTSEKQNKYHDPNLVEDNIEIKIEELIESLKVFFPFE